MIYPKNPKENKEKPKVDTNVWLFFWFWRYLKGKVEWKTFEEIDMQWMYLKFVIVYFKEKNLTKSLHYYKKLNKGCVKFLSERHSVVYKGIQKHILYILMKRKWNMVDFVKFWLRMYSIIEGENEKKFLYTIYSYIQKCEIQHYEGKLKEKDRESINIIVDNFWEWKNNNFYCTTDENSFIVTHCDVSFLEVPISLLQQKKV